MTDEVPRTRREAREAEQAKEAQRASEAKAAKSAGKTQRSRAVPTTVSTPNADPTAIHLTPAEPATEVLSSSEPQAAPRRGFAATFARHPNAWMYSSLGVIFLLLGTVSVFTGVAVGSAETVPVVQETATPTPEPTRDAPAEAAAGTALRTCTIASLASDSRLQTFEGSVINITTGEVLYDYAGTEAAPPASGLKVITAAAALLTLGPDFQMSTRVFEGLEPGSIVLVGQGDVTLSRVNESVYKGAPKLSDLAAQTRAKWEAEHPDDEITTVILDASYWSTSDRWDPTWESSERGDGSQADVTALMVDGDRDNPAATQSRRSNDPVARAGEAFVAALNLENPVEVVIGNATPGLPQLAEVKSQPIANLIPQMLEWSDNALAETIARVISVQRDGRGTAASLGTIIPGVLANLGLDATTISIRDGSGLSNLNRVPPLFMAQLMAKVATGEQGFGVIKSALPVAGKSGTLRTRFTGASEVARGNVFAKTGWITGSRTLSGFLNAQDGSLLSFALYATGPVKQDATVALDAVATGIYTCGNNLSNN